MASQDEGLALEMHSQPSDNGPAIGASLAMSLTNVLGASTNHCFEESGEPYHAYKLDKHHMPHDELHQEGLDLYQNNFSLHHWHYNSTTKTRQQPARTEGRLVLPPNPGHCKMIKVPTTSASKQKHSLIAGDICVLSFCLFLVLSSFMSVAVADLGSGWRVPLLPFSFPLIHAEAHAEKSSPASNTQRFTLRDIYHHGATLFPDIHRRLELNPDMIKSALQGADLRDSGVGLYTTSSTLLNIWRLRDRRVEYVESLLSSAQPRGSAVRLPDSAWNLSEVSSPNITDKETVVNLALMAASAYNFDNTAPDWEDVKKPFNLSSDVGWEDDGLRGHVFADETNSTIVIAIKGTTSAIFDGSGTTTNDKINDNLFAGCCCGQGTLMAKKACDCQTATYTCNENCICEEMHKRSRYYQASIELYGNITQQYPNANVWLTGHSLGGLVTTLLGLTFGIPVVTFEAVPQALAASRLGLPTPPGYDSAVAARQDGAVWHFGHTADPVYMGTCNGATSLCTMAGYALQSQCHTGLRCVYDVVKDHNWRVSIATHGIRPSIKDVYRVYDQVPTCEPDIECVDCYQWKRDYRNITKTTTKTSTTSTSSSKTRTRTATCKTPGWWGCLDETTTTPVSTRTSTATSTITTCLSHGWFGGCLESTTTTATSTTTIVAATATVNRKPYVPVHTDGY